MDHDYSVTLDRDPGLAQGDERLTVAFADGRREEMRLHEYDRVYAVPGLYEEVVQRELDCRSPATLATALLDAVGAAGGEASAIRALDFGAGNGVVGEELRARGVTGPLVGVDAAAGSREAAERDRPGQYAEYVVGDLADISVPELVERHGLNCLVGAGALGLGHVTAAGFDAAWRAFPTGSWMALTVTDDVLDPDGDDLGAYVAQLRAGEHGTEVVHVERFRHRLRMSGEPIHYHVIVARR
ncbi:MAG: hypothetical protein AB7G37_12910 [Solirubrobacteraceae bacterium]